MRRGVPKVSGIYVKGHIENVDIVYTVDTGASATLVSTKVFEEICEKRKPHLDAEQLPRFMVRQCTVLLGLVLEMITILSQTR